MAKLPNDNIETARAFHEITNHSYTSVRSGAHVLDWGNRPLPYKIYPDAGTLNLPRGLTLSEMPTLAALREETSAPADTQLDLESLTRLLFCADGLTRRVRVGAEDYHFRAAASAGALYPIEIYIAAAEVDGLEPGLYHFSPADLKLRGLRRGDWRPLLAGAAAMRASVAQARAVLVVSAIFWRSAWKYRTRAYRYCFWDAGTILANLLATANAERIEAEAVTAFEDARVESLLEVDGEREGIVCMVALGRTGPATAASPQLSPLELETIPLSPREVVYDDLVKLHRESRLTSAAEVSAVASAAIDLAATRASTAAEIVRPEVLGPEAGMGLGATILRRGSTRIFTREPISAEELATIMAASSQHPRVGFRRLSDTYLIINAVDGMKPGAYYYRRESAEFELLKPGNFRDEAGYLGLEQPLAADCSALICYMADLERALAALGNRGYRDAHLEAGILGGRAYLAAYSLERGATGLTFYDQDTSRFFAPHAAGKSPLLMVAVGVPRSRATHSEAANS
ncbi:MAG: SagB/ThcOx family dehydrogenase [Candidatus Binataceae bacterium]